MSDNLLDHITPQPLHWTQTAVQLTPEQWQANREYAAIDCPRDDYKAGYFDPVTYPEHPASLGPVAALVALVSNAAATFPDLLNYH